MSVLIIGNQLAEEAVAGSDELPVEYRRYLGQVAHRLLWTASPGDVLVLPNEPEAAFVEYVWETLGFADQKPVIVIPSVGARDDLLLYPDRLADPEFVARLRSIVGSRDVQDVNAFYFDAGVARLVRELGLPESPHRAFLEQSGNRLVNSKSTFRAVASGLGLSIPEGLPTEDARQVEEFAWPRIAVGGAVIVKQDNHAGGYGNDLLKHPSSGSGFGVSRVIDVADRRALEAEIESAWDRWTAHGTRGVVVEDYSVGSIPLYAEFFIDGTATLVGHGEMRVRETESGTANGGLIVPAVRALASPHHAQFLEEAKFLADALGALGYRGSVSVDSILLLDGRILLNEFNGRISGSTHIHTLSSRLIGETALHDRVVLVRSRRKIPSVEHALRVLDDRGIGFDHESRTGVLIGSDDGQVIFVARELNEAEHLEQLLADALNPVGAAW